MTHRLNLFLLALLLLIGGPYYWLLLDNRPGDVAAKPVSIAQLRSLAASMPGPAPTAIEVEASAWARMPGNLFAAGIGMKRRLIAKMAFRLPVPGSAPIVIDTGLTAEEAETGGMEAFDPIRQQKISAALRDAGMILLTHEHIDHAGGLVSLAGESAVQVHAWLNPAQLAAYTGTAAQPRPAGPAPVARLGSAIQVVAPGVVVIPAPSHTPGSQLIYVRLADGREYLFAGDICSLAIGCQELRARSRLISSYIPGGENRREVYAWLKTIAALQASAPGLVVVPGHDFEWLIEPKNHSGVRHGFSPSAN